ncbi:MAG: hypothetical protein DRJ03_30665, partial [Chloroflexi bacterium]
MGGGAAKAASYLESAVIADKLTRRTFLKFILVTGATVSLPVLTHC